MDPKTLDYIRTLTSTDEKNLTQKTLKLVEELGELAAVILPYENAYATNHRFIDRERILEELADSFLCHMSVVYDMGFTDEELEQAVIHKMKFWADLQARERRIAGKKIPYEIHVTVEAERSDLSEFKLVCGDLGVKPILLDLHVNGQEPIKDLMTSSVFMGNNREAYEELQRIASGLRKADFQVVREKIETIPWHPAAPSEKHEQPVMPPNCYFECHLAVLCTKSNESELDVRVGDHGAHKSRNVFKRYKDGTYTVMITLRTYEGFYENFKDRVYTLRGDLELAGFEVAKEIVEFSIYDTKVSHDAAWITESPGANAA